MVGGPHTGEIAMMSSGARADVLTAVRRALGQTPGDRAAEYAAIERGYAAGGGLDASQRVALFADRLIHYNVGVHHTDAVGLPATIGEVSAARGKRHLVVPDGFPGPIIPQTLEAVPDMGLSYEELDRCEGVLTLATIAIALTGTIVLTH